MAYFIGTKKFPRQKGPHLTPVLGEIGLREKANGQGTMSFVERDTIKEANQYLSLRGESTKNRVSTRDKLMAIDAVVGNFWGILAARKQITLEGYSTSDPYVGQSIVIHRKGSSTRAKVKDDLTWMRKGGIKNPR